MIDRQAANFTSLVDALTHQGRTAANEDLSRIAMSLGRMFDVDADEVAILALSSHGKSLKFVLPEKLAAVGTLPMTSTSALAPRTVRESKAEIINNFGAFRHASVFEGVSLGRKQGELIHKIMSAPILDGERVIGVVQISRKGQTPSEAGPDFTSKDLRLLISLSPTLVRVLKICEIA